MRVCNYNSSNQQPTPLPRDSKEYAQVLYQLELGGKPWCKSNTCTSMGYFQTNIVENFEREVRKTPGVVPLDTWIDVDGLDYNSEKMFSNVDLLFQ